MVFALSIYFSNITILINNDTVCGEGVSTPSILTLSHKNVLWIHSTRLGPFSQQGHQATAEQHTYEDVCQFSGRRLHRSWVEQDFVTQKL